VIIKSVPVVLRFFLIHCSTDPFKVSTGSIEKVDPGKHCFFHIDIAGFRVQTVFRMDAHISSTYEPMLQADGMVDNGLWFGFHNEFLFEVSVKTIYHHSLHKKTGLRKKERTG